MTVPKFEVAEVAVQVPATVAVTIAPLFLTCKMSAIEPAPRSVMLSLPLLVLITKVSAPALPVRVSPAIEVVIVSANPEPLIVVAEPE